MEHDKNLVIIPAKNEEENLEKVIFSIPNNNKILVINDNSDDKTEEILIRNKIEYLTTKDFGNICGYDAAINIGIRYALKNKYHNIITFDADGELPSNMINEFFFYLKNYDIVVGQRKTMRFSERIFSIITSFFLQVQDPLCGMKSYQTKLFSDEQFKETYHIGTKYIIKFSKITKIKNIPILTNKIKRNSRFGNFFTSNMKIFFVLFNSFFFIILQGLKNDK